MSRGPGVWQRRILDLVADGGVVQLTHAGQSHAEQNAIRRAARTLEAAGKIRVTSLIIDRVPRLVAGSIDAELPAPFVVTGMDGKQYMMPNRAE